METNMKKIKLTETELTNIIKKIINESQLLTENCYSPCPASHQGKACDGSGYASGTCDKTNSTWRTIIWMGCITCACYCSNEVPGPGKVLPGGDKLSADMDKQREIS